MGNLKEILEGSSSIGRLDEWYLGNHKQRRYLGLSQLGHKCEKFVWLKSHGYKEASPSAKLLRIFLLGNLLEKQIRDDLIKSGFFLNEAQKEVIFGYGDLTLSGHIDGIITDLTESGKPHLWEFKTMNDKSFKKVLKDGYEAYNSSYKAQIHAYMLGLPLIDTLVMVYNKNTSELYQERIKLNKKYIIDLLQDRFWVIKMENSPIGTCKNNKGRDALLCPYLDVCWPR